MSEFDEKLLNRLHLAEREIERLKRWEHKSKAEFDAEYLPRFTPLTTPLTSTAWDGDSFSTTAKTLIDLSAVFGAPAGVTAVETQIVSRDSGSAASTTIYFGLSPNDTSGSASLFSSSRGLPNDTLVYLTGIVPCNADGDIYYQIVASGVSTLDVTLRIWGYWL